MRAPLIATAIALGLFGFAACAGRDAGEPAAAASKPVAPAPAGTAQPSNRPPDEQQTRERMAEIFAAMRYLLPLSLDDQGFENPAETETIRMALALLDDSARQLAQHGASREVPFAHLARSLAIDARDIHERYEQGHMREARYLVQTLAETCVACHSRLPAANDAPRSEEFLADASVERLPAVQRAKLAFATRQFDEALALYEAVLADPSFPANDIDLEGHLDDYLELVLRVRGEPARALAALRRFSQRKDLSPTLRGEVQHWIAALAALVARGPVTDPVGVARATIDRAEAAQPEVDERDSLVELLDASSLLHRFLADGQPPHEEQAEAYFLLGVIETRIGRSFWLSQAEAYLETAIRLAPGKPIAKDSYALLEDFLVAGYSGSGGSFVPEDVREKLGLLRKISEGQAPADS